MAADRAVRPRPALKAGMSLFRANPADAQRKSLNTVAAAAAISATIVMRPAPGASVYPAVRETIWTEFPDLPIP